jgi:hypothetical protein
MVSFSDGAVTPEFADGINDPSSKLACRLVIIFQCYFANGVSLGDDSVITSKASPLSLS